MKDFKFTKIDHIPQGAYFVKAFTHKNMLAIVDYKAAGQRYFLEIDKGKGREYYRLSKGYTADDIISLVRKLSGLK